MTAWRVQAIKEEDMNLFEKYYDKEYEKERDKFVPPAEKYANNLCGASIKTRNEEERSAWNSKWNLTFHKKMNRLSLCLFKGDCSTS